MGSFFSSESANKRVLLGALPGSQLKREHRSAVQELFQPGVPFQFVDSYDSGVEMVIWLLFEAGARPRFDAELLRREIAATKSISPQAKVCAVVMSAHGTDVHLNVKELDGDLCLRLDDSFKAVNTTLSETNDTLAEMYHLLKQ